MKQNYFRIGKFCETHGMGNRLLPLVTSLLMSKFNTEISKESIYF